MTTTQIMRDWANRAALYPEAVAAILHQERWHYHDEELIPYCVRESIRAAAERMAVEDPCEPTSADIGAITVTAARMVTGDV